MKKETKLYQELPVVHEIGTQPLRNAENPLSMGYIFQYFFMKMLTEFNYTFLMTGRTKITLLAGERKQVFVMAIITLDSCEALMRVTTVQIFIYHIKHVGSPIPVLLLVLIFP